MKDLERGRKESGRGWVVHLPQKVKRKARI
jgi:hypothetical protein